MVTQNHFVIPATVLEKFRSQGFPEGVTLTADHCTYIKLIFLTGMCSGRKRLTATLWADHRRCLSQMKSSNFERERGSKTTFPFVSSLSREKEIARADLGRSGHILSEQLHLVRWICAEKVAWSRPRYSLNILKSRVSTGRGICSEICTILPNCSASSLS